jgi:hypothetical protein
MTVKNKVRQTNTGYPCRLKIAFYRRTSGTLVSNYSVKQQQQNYVVLLNPLQFLDAFPELRKATTIFVMSAVSPSLRDHLYVCT